MITFTAFPWWFTSLSSTCRLSCKRKDTKISLHQVTLYVQAQRYKMSLHQVTLYVCSIAVSVFVQNLRRAGCLPFMSMCASLPYLCTHNLRRAGCLPCTCAAGLPGKGWRDWKRAKRQPSLCNLFWAGRCSHWQQTTIVVSIWQFVIYFLTIYKWWCFVF